MRNVRIHLIIDAGFSHHGDFLMTQYQLIGLSMAFFVRWVIWYIVDKMQTALYPRRELQRSDILLPPNQDAIKQLMAYSERGWICIGFVSSCWKDNLIEL